MKEDGSTQKVIIPFNSKYKFMVSVNWVADPSQGGKMRPAVLMKGAAELIFQRCSRMVKGDGYEDITSEKVEHFQAAQKDLAGRGERVIGFCMKFLDEDDTYNCVNQPGESDIMTVNGAPFDSSGEPLDPNKEGYYPIGSKQFLDWGGDDNINGCMTSQGLTPPEAAWDSMDFVGLISLIDPPREAVPGSVLLCRKAGVKVVMVTGDQPLTAAAIARKVNIIKEGAMTIEGYADHHGLDYDGTAATISSVEQHAMSAYQNMPQEQRDSDEYSHLRYTKSMIEAKVIPGWELKSMSTEDIKLAFMYATTDTQADAFHPCPNPNAHTDTKPAREVALNLQPVHSTLKFTCSHPPIRYRDLVFARTSPEQKLKIVNAAQDMGHVVAVTGKAL